jgi:L-lactate dehydrogenase complex protein LldG
MSSRDTILQRIRESIAGGQAVERPDVPAVWPRETSDPAALANRFINELDTVQGEVIRCNGIDDARRKLVELIDGSEWPSVAAADTPLVRDALGELDAARVAYPEKGFEPSRLADIPAGIVEAEYLLADTGSCVVRAREGEARLLVYLPEASVIIARSEQLREHMPAAWEEIAQRLREEDFVGEWVVVTGPSRTADIEKILILGVHGPRRLTVLLID